MRHCIEVVNISSENLMFEDKKKFGSCYVLQGGAFYCVAVTENYSCNQTYTCPYRSPAHFLYLIFIILIIINKENRKENKCLMTISNYINRRVISTRGLQCLAFGSL